MLKNKEDDMFEHTQNGITVSFENKEFYQHHRNHNGDKSSRFIKRAQAKVFIFGEEYSESFVGVVTFLISVLRMFLHNNMGKRIYKWYVHPDYVTLADYNDVGPCTSCLVARKKEEKGDQVLVLESADEDGQILRTQILDRCECLQLDLVLSRVFSFLSPDNPMTDEDIYETNKEKKWADMDDVRRREYIERYSHTRKVGLIRDKVDHIIPASVLQSLKGT